MKNLKFAVIGFIALALIILFTTQKKEGTKEAELWKIDIDSIQYTPPKQIKGDWIHFPNQKIKFTRFQESMKSSPYYLMIGTDTEIPYTYLAGYNIKNMFIELSYFQSPNLIEATPENQKQLEISDEISPKVDLYKGNSIAKTMQLGGYAQNKFERYVKADKIIVKTSAHLFDRLRGNLFTLREKQLIMAGNSFIHEILYKKDNQSIILSNKPKETNQKSVNVWTMNDGKIPVSLQIGNEVESRIKNLYIDKYPDEPSGGGMTKVNQSVQNEPIIELKIIVHEQWQYILKFYPTTNISGQPYNPVVREILGKFKESPVYIHAQVVKTMIDSLDKLKKYSEKK